MLKVIVVDDEPTIRKGLVNCIDWDKVGCSVTGIFTNGYEALESIKISPPDIILTDIRMPRINGLELAQYLYENNYKCKVIILTAYPDFNYSQEAIQYGVIDFVVKPTSPQRLIESIKKAKSIIEKEQLHLTNISPIELPSKQYLESINELILLNIINGVYSNESLIENKLSNHNINMNDYICLLIHVKIPCSLEYYQGITQMKLYIDQVFIHTHHYTVFTDESHIILICSVDKKSSNLEPLQIIVILCEELLALTQAFLDFDINIGISSLYNSPIELSTAYKESKAALQYKFYSDSDFIFISSQDNISKNSSHKENLNHIILQVKKTIVSNNYIDLFKNTVHFFDILKAAMYPMEKVYRYIFLLLTCFHQLNENILDSHNNIERFISLQSQIYKATNIDALYHTVTSYMEILVKELSYETLNRDLIKQVDSYIQQNFQEDLTLSNIAKHFHLNSSYLSRLYKKQTNENLIVALTKVRIEQAKKILLTTDKLIYEVAQDVGIGDPTYFSQVFKRYTGFNPSEYKTQSATIND